MSLTAADVAEIMRLLEQSSFDELNLEMNGVKLSLRRGAAVGGGSSAPSFGAAAGAASGGGLTSGAAAGNASGTAAGSNPGATGSNTARGNSDTSAARASAPTGTADGAAATPAGVVTPAASTDPNVHDVPSPLLGTFYRSPKPGAPPFVEVGSPVEENTIVAIIEVMKLMNTVRAGARGTVAEILPGDGTLVEYDQPLLRIRKAG